MCLARWPVGVALAATLLWFRGVPTSVAASVPAVSATGIGYGLMAVNPGRGLDRAQDLGFNWVKMFTEWSGVQPTPAPTYYWNDSFINSARGRGLQILMRLDGAPGWARDPSCNEPDQFNYPPGSNAEMAEFVYRTALHWRGKVAAYEIFNEPNVANEWGGCNPDPVRYASLLAAIYPRLKQGDLQRATGDGRSF